MQAWPAERNDKPNNNALNAVANNISFLLLSISYTILNLID